jgi:type IV pilus biogenesis protein CpaD/CtpE
MSLPVKKVMAVVLVLALVGCASHPPRVDCEAHLRPINAPAPVKPTSAHP